jgi:hypothetical protein
MLQFSNADEKRFYATNKCICDNGADDFGFALRAERSRDFRGKTIATSAAESLCAARNQSPGGQHAASRRTIRAA